MATTTEQFARLEDRVNRAESNVSELRGAYDHLATKADIERMASTLTWRMVLISVLVQGIVAAGIKYLP